MDDEKLQFVENWTRIAQTCAKTVLFGQGCSLHALSQMLCLSVETYLTGIVRRMKRQFRQGWWWENHVFLGEGTG